MEFEVLKYQNHTFLKTKCNSVSIFALLIMLLLVNIHLNFNSIVLKIFLNTFSENPMYAQLNPLIP